MKEFKEILNHKLLVIEEIIKWDTELLQEPIFDEDINYLNEDKTWALPILVGVSIAELTKLQEKLNHF